MNCAKSKEISTKLQQIANYAESIGASDVHRMLELDAASFRVLRFMAENEVNRAAVVFMVGELMARQTQIQMQKN